MLRLFALIAGFGLFGAELSAQEFSVYTRIFNLDHSPDKQPVAFTRTLFHAGKVYDVIHGAAEVTILEPAHQRILILNSDRQLLSVVDFDELKHLLRTAEERLAQRVRELEDQENPPQPQIDALRFQLRPQFESHFDSREPRLRLRSKSISYDVVGPADVRPEEVAAYLNYADWMCRLNYVLHPQPLFPNVRLELNEKLKQRKLLPIEVTLQAKFEQPLNLKAEHSVTWSLDARGRQQIHHWESLLRDPKLQKVPLSEYQRIGLHPLTAKLTKPEVRK
jgi:hypothetical protein